MFEIVALVEVVSPVNVVKINCCGKPDKTEMVPDASVTPTTIPEPVLF